MTYKKKYIIKKGKCEETSPYTIIHQFNINCSFLLQT